MSLSLLVGTTVTFVLFSSFQVTCKRLGGHLAVIETPQENEFVSQDANASPGEYIFFSHSRKVSYAHLSDTFWKPILPKICAQFRLLH